MDYARKQQIMKDLETVDNFYRNALKDIENKIEKNQDSAKYFQGQEDKITEQIDKLESEKNEINNKPSNHVNDNVANRLKNFNLEINIFNIENDIKKLKNDLELQRRINEIEIDYLKEKNEKLEKDYEKYYEEKKIIDDAIFIHLLGNEINIGAIKGADEIKKENDMVFKRVLK